MQVRHAWKNRDFIEANQQVASSTLLLLSPRLPKEPEKTQCIWTMKELVFQEAALLRGALLDRVPNN